MPTRTYRPKTYQDGSFVEEVVPPAPIPGGRPQDVEQQHFETQIAAPPAANSGRQLPVVDPAAGQPGGNIQMPPPPAVRIEGPTAGQTGVPQTSAALGGAPRAGWGDVEVYAGSPSAQPVPLGVYDGKRLIRAEDIDVNRAYQLLTGRDPRAATQEEIAAAIAGEPLPPRGPAAGGQAQASRPTAAATGGQAQAPRPGSAAAAYDKWKAELRGFKPTAQPYSPVPMFDTEEELHKKLGRVWGEGWVKKTVMTRSGPEVREVLDTKLVKRITKQLPNGKWVDEEDYDVAAAYLGDPRAIHRLAHMFAQRHPDYSVGYRQGLAAIEIAMGGARARDNDAARLALEEIREKINNPNKEAAESATRIEQEKIRQAEAAARAALQEGLIKSAQAQKIIDQGIAEGLTGDDLKRYVLERSHPLGLPGEGGGAAVPSGEMPSSLEGINARRRLQSQAEMAGDAAASAGNAPAAGRRGGTAAALETAGILKEMGFTPPSPAEAILGGNSAAWGVPVADPKTNAPVNLGQVIDRLSKLDSSKVSDDLMDKILMAYGKMPRAQLLRDIMKAYTYNAALAGHQLEPLHGTNAGLPVVMPPGPLPGGWHMQDGSIRSGVLTKGDRSISYPWSGVASPLSRYWHGYSPMGAAWSQSGRDEALQKALAASRALDAYARLYGMPNHSRR